MEITSNHPGAATFAMKQAMALPNIVLDLVRHSAGADEPSLALPRPVDPALLTGKGKIIDVVA